MRVTIRHHFDFGADRAVVGADLVRLEAWDALRTRMSGCVRDHSLLPRPRGLVARATPASLDRVAASGMKRN